MKRILFAALLSAALLAPFAVQAQAQTAPAADASLRLVLVRVFTTDLNRAERFYRDVFGLTQTQNFGANERVLNLPGAGAPRLVLAQTEQPRGNGSYAVSVSDIDGVMSRAAAAGATITRPASAPSAQMGGVRIGLFTDPDGTLVEVIQPPAGR